MDQVHLVLRQMPENERRMTPDQLYATPYIANTLCEGDAADANNERVLRMHMQRDRLRLDFYTLKARNIRLLRERAYLVFQLERLDILRRQYAPPPAPAAPAPAPAPAPTPAPTPCTTDYACSGTKRPATDAPAADATRARGSQDGITADEWRPRTTCLFCGAAPPCPCQPERISSLPIQWRDLIEQVTCVISHEVIRNPVATEVGSVYEGAAICEYLRAHAGDAEVRDPATQLVLHTRRLRSSPFAETTLRSLWSTVLKLG